MKIIGIICEYNPFHLGHQKQLQQIRAEIGADCGIVCLMSGNFVQRGQPAITDKLHRARAALLCGADLVLELPVTAALSSAEGFAANGVSILGPFCDQLCFGAESGDTQALMETARVLLSEPFSEQLRQQLQLGISFPAARQRALQQLGLDGTLLTSPNNILAVEYCKAILSQGCAMVPMPILRAGDYHAAEADPDNPSATSLRRLMLSGKDWLPYVPQTAAQALKDAPLHTLSAGERIILARLRTMTEEAFEALPYGSEGLWRKLMHASRKEATLEEILQSVKSRRYTRTRLDRMVMCACLGLTRTDLETPAPYTRVLGFNQIGREILKTARKFGAFPNIGEKIDHPWQSLENRCSDLYGLFAVGTPEKAGMEGKKRVIVL